eukprot:362255-Chlamydomonas_euryale.AAC.1
MVQIACYRAARSCIPSLKASVAGRLGVPADACPSITYCAEHKHTVQVRYQSYRGTYVGCGAESESELQGYRGGMWSVPHKASPAQRRLPAAAGPFYTCRHVNRCRRASTLAASPSLVTERLHPTGKSMVVTEHLHSTGKQGGAPHPPPHFCSSAPGHPAAPGQVNWTLRLEARYQLPLPIYVGSYPTPQPSTRGALPAPALSLCRGFSLPRVAPGSHSWRSLQAVTPGGHSWGVTPGPRPARLAHVPDVWGARCRAAEAVKC